MDNPIFHDATILGIEYQEESCSLILKIRLSNNEIILKLFVVFEGLFSYTPIGYVYTTAVLS